MTALWKFSYYRMCSCFCFAGTDVVIVKSGRRICGTGGCLANAPLHQNKSYFEFKIQSTGECLVGAPIFSYQTHRKK